jgi:hypothetical protein
MTVRRLLALSFAFMSMLALPGCISVFNSREVSADYLYSASTPDALLFAPQGGFGLITVILFGKLSADGSALERRYMSIDLHPVFSTNGKPPNMKGARVEPGKYALISISQGSGGVNSRFECFTGKTIVIDLKPGEVAVFENVDLTRARGMQSPDYDPQASAKLLSDARGIVATYPGITAPVELVRIDRLVSIRTRPDSFWDGKCNKYYEVTTWQPPATAPN